MIGIIDYGAGNLRSVQNAFDYLGAKTQIVREAENLTKFDRVLLPGVGAFGEAMSKIRALNLDVALREFIASGKPFLGICLGMQLLFEKSYEFGETAGLGVINGEVVKFDTSKFSDTNLSPQNSTFAPKIKIPHIGWNGLKFAKEIKINANLNDEIYLYFVHSYHVLCDDSVVLGRTNYGYEFVSAVAKDNVFGFQAHPEKSHKNGLKIIKNFMEL
ncbi:MAG: imidazole glycerol phosphate synthase subunit HisH [Campylobacter sp.]